MTGKTEIITSKRHLKRAVRNRWEDGITEIFIGMGVFLYALFQSLLIAITADETDASPAQIIITVVLSCLVILAGIVIFRWAGERIKARTTYPRTGYVEVKRQRIRFTARNAILIIVLVPISLVVSLGLLLGLMLFFAYFKINAALLLYTSMLAFPAAATGRRTGLPRFYALAGAIMLVAIILTATNTLDINLLLGAIGVLLMLSGGLALTQYLRTHPVEASS